MQVTQQMYSVGVKQLVSFLLLGVVGLAILQTVKAQPQQASSDHTVAVNVNQIHAIEAPEDVSINITAGLDDNSLTGTGSGSYEVISNLQETVQIDVSGNQGQNTGELKRLEILRSGTDAPADASVKSGSISLLNRGTPRLTTGGFEGVNAENLNVQYEAEVSPDFDPSNTAKVKVTYTLTGGF